MMTVTAWLVVAALAMAPPAPPGNDARPRLGAAGASDFDRDRRGSATSTVRLHGRHRAGGYGDRLEPRRLRHRGFRRRATTLPWSELRFDRGSDARMHRVAHRSRSQRSGRDGHGRRDAPRFDVLTRDGTPVALLRLDRTRVESRRPIPALASIRFAGRRASKASMPGVGAFSSTRTRGRRRRSLRFPSMRPTSSSRFAWSLRGFERLALA